jgi:hypothetical protein
MTSTSKSGAALSGSLDMESFVETPPSPNHIVFDPNDDEEVRLRNPLAFARSQRIPLTLYAEQNQLVVNESYASEARTLGKKCEVVLVPGDHQSMVAPAVKKAIAQVRAVAGE